MRCGAERSATASPAANYLSTLLPWILFVCKHNFENFLCVRNKDIVACVYLNM